MECGLCRKDLPQDGDYVACGKCLVNLHFNCAKLQKTTWKAKSSKKKSEWECSNCRSSAGKARTPSVECEEDDEIDDPTYLALKKLLEKMFKRQEDKIVEKVNKIEVLMGKIEETMNNLIDKVREVEENCLDLRREVEELKLDIEIERQYGRSKNFIVTSIPHSDKEDVPEKICDLLHRMNLSLKKEEITAHRLPSTRSPAPIIVQCTTRAIRDNIVRAARKARPKTSLINNDQPEKSIFFNDHLTPYFTELMKKAREFKDEKGFKFIWLNGNRIMLKKDNMSKAFQVKTLKDLDKLN